MKKIFILIVLIFGLSLVGMAQTTISVPVVSSQPATPIAGLPPGITMNAQGVLSGTPTASGTYQFTVQACDTETPPQCDTRQFQLVVLNKVQITTTALPPGIVQVPYTPFPIGVTGGNGVYVFTIQ